MGPVNSWETITQPSSAKELSRERWSPGGPQQEWEVFLINESMSRPSLKASSDSSFLPSFLASFIQPTDISRAPIRRHAQLLWPFALAVGFAWLGLSHTLLFGLLDSSPMSLPL